MEFYLFWYSDYFVGRYITGIGDIGSFYTHYPFL